MKLRTKMILSFLVIVPLWATAFIVISEGLIMSGFTRIERRDILANAQSFDRLVNDQLNGMSNVEAQYSAWNDTYQFVQQAASGLANMAKNNASDYIAQNYGSPTYTINQFNVILLFNRSGQIVYGQAYDLLKNRFVKIPAGLLQQIREHPLWLRYQNPLQYRTGIVSLKSGLLEIIGQPIVTSTFQGPADGTMIAGRYLNASQIGVLSRLLGHPVSISPYAQNELPTRFAANSRASFAAIPMSSIWTNRTPQQIGANMVLFDISRKPVAILRVSKQRTIHELGQSIVWSVVLFLFASLVVFSLLTWALLEKTVFSRVQTFTDHLKYIQKKRDMSSRIDDSGNDEIAGVARQFNQMMHSLEESQNIIFKQARYDGLTGLPNRYQLYEIMGDYLEAANRQHTLVAVLFIDLDNFKAVNDSCGHSVGDLLLMKVAERMRLTVEDKGVAARLAGDEFVLLLHPVYDVNQAEAVAITLLQTLAEPLAVNRQQLSLAASIGISIYPQDGADAETLIRRADMAMYHAKKDIQHRYCIVTEEMKNGMERGRRLERDLKVAIQRSQLEMEYQPKVCVHTNKVVGMEALIRWNHPQLGRVSPAEFIEIAESTGMIVEIGTWVLKTVCAQNSRWLDNGVIAVPVAVNVSPVQFDQDDFVQVVKDVLVSVDLPGRFLEIEVTERIALRRLDMVAAKLKELKELGIRVSIDDFGIGYSSLSYLKSLPVDHLKIDRSFINNVLTNTEDQTIVQLFIQLAHHLHITAIAEGVETIAQLNFLRANRCDIIQGYLFSRPLPVDRVEVVCREGLLLPIPVSDEYSVDALKQY